MNWLKIYYLLFHVVVVIHLQRCISVGKERLGISMQQAQARIEVKKLEQNFKKYADNLRTLEVKIKFSLFTLQFIQVQYMIIIT